MATISKLVANPSVVASSSSAWSSDRSILVGSGRYVPFRSIAVSPVRLSIRVHQTQKRRVVVKAKSGKEPLKKTTLHSLYEEQGLSPWYDNLCRPVTDLLPLIAKGVRGVTSNPTIFQKAISSSSAYDEQFKFLTGVEGKDVEKAYWEMVIKDIKDACRLFQSIYDETDGGDGYVSVEVSPRLANDTNRTIEAAKWLHKVVNRPNVYIKIPATVECVPSIKEVIANGISVNVTLIFSLARYEAVIDAYLDGLEASSLKDLSRVTSVASFFVSRVDTLIDKKLENIGTPEALDLRGKAAVAQAKLAYKLYQKKFSGPRWEALVKKGAKKQRLLFASTGVKNPAYPDTLYVDSLIGPDTVSTMPDQALEAVLDHGTVKRTIDSKLSEAEGVYSALEKYGINWTQIGTQLELEGVDSFKSSFDSLLISLEEKKSNILKSSKNKKSSTDKDAAEYVKKLDEVQKKTGLTDAVQTGIGEINGIPVAIAVMDFNFIGGSMGSVVGEKITRLIEYATDKTLPVILVCASGGARMQEGSFSLMQMAKISSAMLDYQSKKKSFIVTILSSPTTGGVTASFAMLADVVIGEPDAYIAFAGKIVIEEVMKIKVPEGVQKAEYLFEHGNLDLIVPRYYQKEVLTELLTMHGFPPVGKK